MDVPRRGARHHCAGDQLRWRRPARRLRPSLRSSITKQQRYPMTNFRGVVPPVVTPLTENYEVDYRSYTRVLEHLIAGGVHGLFVLGSTSEVIFHDETIRRQILEHTVKVVNGRLPVFFFNNKATT